MESIVVVLFSNAVAATALALVAGRAVDAQGRPVSGARVRIKAAGRKFIEGRRAGSDGTFAFEGLSPGDYVLDSWHNAYVTRVMKIHLEEGQTLSNKTVLLKKGLSISGLVLDPEGKPLAKAGVSARPEPYNKEFIHTAYTNRKGEYEVTGLKPGRHRIIVHSPYSDTLHLKPSRPVVRAGAGGVDFVLGLYGIIRGTVSAPAGSPGAFVVRRYKDDPVQAEAGFVGRPGAFVQGASAGSFELRMVKPGTYWLQARAAGFKPGPLKKVDVKTGDIVSDVVLKLGARRKE